MIKAFIFDFDGTLVDSIEYLYKNFKKTLFDLGIKNEEIAEEYKKEIGKSFDEIYRSLSKKYKELAEIGEEKFLEAWRKNLYAHLHELNFVNGWKELLDFLKEKGIKTAIASSSSRRLITTFLKYKNAEKYFDVIVTYDDVLKSKPEPDLFIKAMELLNVRPEETVVVEDSVYGVIAGKRAGCKVFGVLSGIGKEEELRQAGADLIFKDLYDIYLYLKNLERS